MPKELWPSVIQLLTACVAAFAAIVPTEGSPVVQCSLWAECNPVIIVVMLDAEHSSPSLPSVSPDDQTPAQESPVQLPKVAQRPFVAEYLRFQGIQASVALGKELLSQPRES